jgi:hypothetical protein
VQHSPTIQSHQLWIALTLQLHWALLTEVLRRQQTTANHLIASSKVQIYSGMMEIAVAHVEQLIQNHTRIIAYAVWIPQSMIIRSATLPATAVEGG